ncbi:hypothetical protein E4U32_004546 [Claviceps aff. humidiphila group G2b]|nr:hypothetical protein E4U32_004546 [Claviceps aff. humidiphila group G2b]
MPTTVKLASVEHWARWFEDLKQTAEGQNIWHKVDPDLPSEASDLLQEPELPSNAVLEQYITDRSTRNHVPQATMLEAIQFYHLVHFDACSKYESQEAKEIVLHTWIANTVNPSLHSLTLEAIRTETGRRQVTLREITKKLKSSFSPGLMNLKDETATLYKELLDEARWASTSPDKWIEKWNNVYHKAVRHDIDEIKGANAILKFIQAVGVNFEPTWAKTKIMKLIEYNNNIPMEFTLKSVSDEFMRYRKARVHEKGNTKRLRTRGGASKPSSDTWNKSKSLNCSCGNNSDQTKPRKQFPRKVSAAIPDPKMIMAILDPSPGMIESNTESRSALTATDDHHRILAQSTILDNCGAMHVVNNVSLLEPGTFKPTFDEYVDAGTTSYLIFGRGTRILKNVLNGINGPCTEDLVLQDVAVIHDFLTNIVSESKLIETEKDIWYCGADSTLRSGTMQESTVRAQLIRKYGIIFLTYIT